MSPSFHASLTIADRPPDFVYLGGMDPIGMQPYVDFFNYMAYDLHGPWEAWDQGTIIRPQTSMVDIKSTIYPL
jgi:chitinase